LIFIPANKSETAINYKFNKSWLSEISLNHRFVAKQNRTPQNQIFDNSNGEKALKLIGGDYLAAPKAYNLFDLSVSKNYKFKNLGSVNLIFECKNVLNTQYRDYMNRFRYYTDDIGRNISIRTNINF
jgi:iron complex outermembrane receptor protein